MGRGRRGRSSNFRIISTKTKRITACCLSMVKSEMRADMLALRLLHHAERIGTQVASKLVVVQSIVHDY
jgi:hypothetical protein